VHASRLSAHGSPAEGYATGRVDVRAGRRSTAARRARRTSHPSSACCTRVSRRRRASAPACRVAPRVRASRGSSERSIGSFASSLP
jgi:hypothetical protein